MTQASTIDGDEGQSSLPQQFFDQGELVDQEGSQRSSSSDLSYRSASCVLYEFASEKGGSWRVSATALGLRPKVGKQFLGTLGTEAVRKLGF